MQEQECQAKLYIQKKHAEGQSRCLGNSPGDDVLHVLVPQAHSCLASNGSPRDRASYRHNTAHKLDLQSALRRAALAVRNGMKVVSHMNALLLFLRKPAPHPWGRWPYGKWLVVLEAANTTCTSEHPTVSQGWLPTTSKIVNLAEYTKVRERCNILLDLI